MVTTENAFVLHITYFYKGAIGMLTSEMVLLVQLSNKRRRHIDAFGDS